MEIDPFWILFRMSLISMPFLYAGYLQIKILSKQNPECWNCVFGVRKWDLIGHPPKYQYRPNIFCKKNPNEIERQPYDWCGSFIPVKWK